MESIAESIIVFIIEYLDFLAYDNIISGFFKSSKREYEKNERPEICRRGRAGRLTIRIEMNGGL